MTKKVERLRLKQASSILWGLLAVLLIVLVSAFSRAIKTNQSLRQELDTLRPVMTAAVAEQETLNAELAYVQSDEYIEKWSREHAAMTKSNEVLVVTIKTPVSQAPPPTPTPSQILPTPTPTPIPFWLRWWQILKDR